MRRFDIGERIRSGQQSRVVSWGARLSVVCLLCCLLPIGYCQDIDDAPINRGIAKQYFQEAKEMFESDASKFWGTSLDGPIMFVDATSRIVVANQADNEGQLRKVDDVFTGRLAPNVMVANTAIDWGGTKWTMLLWPLPVDEQDRRVLLAHEAWHRIQDQLGFGSSGAPNHHLDSLHGRYLLQLEWRALAAAIQQAGKERKQAISDALHFRNYRHQLFENSAPEEREMELHEGLAEYTGIRVALTRVQRSVRNIEKLANRPSKLKSFVRSFAYLSGPAYGSLLEQADEDWTGTNKLTEDSDLGQLLLNSAEITLADDLKSHVAQRSLVYEGARLWASEKEKDDERRAVIQEYVDKFVNGPRLVLPLANMRMSFNPNELVPIGKHGTVYPTISLTDDWGVLKVVNGALITSDFKSVIVGVPPDYSKATETTEWKLDSNKGWSIRQNDDGTFRIAKDGGK